jgi:hypothetical protein
VDNDFADLEITLANNYPSHVYEVGGIIVFEYPQDARHDFVLVTVSDGDMTSYASFEVEIIPLASTTVPDTVSWIWFLITAILTSIVAALLARRYLGAMKIEDAYVIYKSGKLIDHITRRQSLRVDEDIFSAMLTAIKNYADGSITQDGQERLRTMEFGKKRILIERGEFVFLAIVYTGTKTKRSIESLREVLHRTENRFEDELVGWSGNLETLDGLTDEVREIFGADKDKVISSLEIRE